MSLVSLPAKARGASAFVMPDPASPLYRSFIAVAGSRLQVEKDCRLTGNVHGNANVDLDTGDLLTGNVSAVGRVDNRGTVSGTVTSGAPARTLPQLPTEAQARALANRVFEKDTAFKNAEIDDVVFVAGDAHIEGSLNGTGTIIARGDVLLDDVDANQPITLAPTSRLSILAFHDLHVGKARPFRGLLLAGHNARLAAKASLEGVLVTLHQLYLEHDSHLAFLELDVTPPSISNLTPAGGSLLASATPTIAAAFADDLSGVDPASVHFLLDGTDRTGAAQVTAAGITFTPSTPLPDGTHAAAVSVRDLAGNLAQAQWSFTTDVTPPALAFTAPSATVAVPRPPIAVVYGDATSGIDPTSLRIALDAADITPSCTVGASSASCSSPTLAPGGHSLAAAIRDRAGNSATSSLAFSVVLDTGPVISALAPAAGSLLHTAQPTLSAVFSDPGSAIDPASFRLAVDGADHTAAAQVTAAGFSFTPAIPLAEGAHSAIVQIGNQLGNTAQAQTGFTVDTVAPDLTISAPDAGNNTSLAQFTVTYDDATSGVDLSTLQITLDGASLTGGCAVQAGTATCVPQPQPEGLHVVSAVLDDKAGNMAAANLTYSVVFAPPAVTLATPADGSLVRSPSLPVSGTASGPEPIVAVTVNGLPAALAGGQFQFALTLVEGANSVLVSALDSTGKEGTATATVTLDTQPPALSIDPPAAKLTNLPTVHISGQASDANGIASVTVNGTGAAVRAGAFAADVPVTEGASTVVVQATDLAGNSAVANVAVQRYALQMVAINTPADLSFVAATTVTVTGTVSDPASAVTVNGIAAQLSGGRFVAGGVPLLEGGNIITATAATASGLIGTASIEVVRDLTPPRLSIDHPADGTVVFDPVVTVSGLVNDILPGTVNAADVSVTVNGVPAAVANRSFILPGVALSPGDNTLTALATDAAGNVGKASITVHRIAAATPRLALVSGDHQQAIISQMLPQPLVVAVLDAGGAPVAGKNVLFLVRGGSGTLDGGGRGFVAATDASAMRRPTSRSVSGPGPEARWWRRRLPASPAR